MQNNFAIIIAAYFIGAFPHLLILARLHRIDTSGDLHIGLWQKAGPGWGLLATSIDVFKGIGSAALAGWLGFDIGIVVLCGLMATCGQMWPVFKSFNGEKGNTTGFGAALAIAACPTLLALIPVLLALLSKLIKTLRLKDVPQRQRFKTGAGSSAALPVGVAVALLLLPLFAWLLDEPGAVIYGFAALFGLIMLRRLTANLFRDLKTGIKLRQIIWQRLLLDRELD